jgi:hypothetical protein
MKQLVSREMRADLFLDPENGDDMLLRNVGWILTDYTELFLRPLIRIPDALVLPGFLLQGEGDPVFQRG